MPLPDAMPIHFFFNDAATTETYTLSLHDALPISSLACSSCACPTRCSSTATVRSIPSRTPISSPTLRSALRSEEHTSELQSLRHLVCRLLLEKKKFRTSECGDRI